MPGWLFRYRRSYLGGDLVAALTVSALIVRVDAPLFFANADPVHEHLKELESTKRPLRAVVFDASGVDDLDATADHRLRKLATRWQTDGIALLMVNVNARVRDVMNRSGLAELVGADHFFATDADAIAYLDALGEG